MSEFDRFARFYDADYRFYDEDIDLVVELAQQAGGDALELGIGGMKAETIQSFYDKMVASGVVAAGLDLTKVYSLDFANTGAALPVKKKLLGD